MKLISKIPLKCFNYTTKWHIKTYTITTPSMVVPYFPISPWFLFHLKMLYIAFNFPIQIVSDKNFTNTFHYILLQKIFAPPPHQTWVVIWSNWNLHHLSILSHNSKFCFPDHKVIQKHIFIHIHYILNVFCNIITPHSHCHIISHPKTIFWMNFHINQNKIFPNIFHLCCWICFQKKILILHQNFKIPKLSPFHIFCAPFISTYVNPLCPRNALCQVWLYGTT